VNLSETARVLAKAQAFDNRTVGQANIAAWHEVLADVDFQDALDAITEHHRTSVEYLSVGHVMAGVAAARRRRRDRIQAAGPVDFPTGLTLAEERAYRRRYHQLVGSGVSGPEATAATDREFGYRRPALIPGSIRRVLAGGPIPTEGDEL